MLFTPGPKFAEEAGFGSLAFRDGPLHLGNRLGRKALITHLRGARHIGADHLIFNLKYSKRPADEVLQEPAQYVLPEFA